MADITYGVQVDYLTSGNLSLPSSSLDKATSSFDALKGAAHSFNGVLDSIIGGMLHLGVAAAEGIGAAVAGGFGLALRESIKFNEQMENSQTGIATMANAAEGLNGFLDPKEAFGNQYRLAGDVIKQMRKDAQELPGSFSDLQRIMTDITGPAENIGLGQAGVEKMSASAMAAAAAMNIPFKQVGMQIGEMLSGSARVTNRTFKGLNTGYSSTAFNKLSEKDRLHVTQNALDKMQAGKDSAMGNWSTISSNFVDNLKIAAGVVGGPLLGRVKETMKAFNDSDKGGLANLGKKIGDGLANAFDAGLAAFQKYLPIAETLVGSMHRGFSRIFDKLQPMFSMLEAMITSLLNDPNMFNKIEHMIGQLIALRAGGAVLEGGVGAAGGLLKMGASAGMGAAELGPIVVGLGTAVGLAAIAVAGFTSALTDSGSQLHEGAVNTAKGTAAATARLGRELTEQGTVFKQGAELLGLALARVGENVIGWAADWAHTFNMLGEASQALTNFWMELAGKSKTSYGLPGDADDALKASRNNRDGLFEESAPTTFIKKLDAFAVPEKGAAKPPQHTTHIHKVEIKVNSNQDPSRIAREVKGVLNEEARNPRSAAINPAGRFSTRSF